MDKTFFLDAEHVSRNEGRPTTNTERAMRTFQLFWGDIIFWGVSFFGLGFFLHTVSFYSYCELNSLLGRAAPIASEGYLEPRFKIALKLIEHAS